MLFYGIHFLILIFFFNFNHRLEFSVISYQNFQNTFLFFFLLFLGRKRKNCDDLSIGKNLTEFVKISMLESLKNFKF
jgi:hypothetical protein